MTKIYCTFAGWFLFAACILVTGAERGYSDDLYKASLTGSSLSSYDRDVEGKISIKDNGKVELSIKGLRTYPDNTLVNQNSILVIETEVNESAKTYSKSFTITDGKAEEEFTLNLSNEDKLEILSVAVNKGTSTTTTPTPTTTIAASPTPASSPTATPTLTASPTPTGTATATPTVTASPTPAGSSTAAFMVSATTTTSDTILVPGGLISTSTTTTPSPTPVATASPTPSATVSPTPVSSPTGTPGIINATVEIKETINLKSKGKFKAFITLPSPYSVNNIDVDTVECEGAQAIGGKVDKTRFIATFRVQDLELPFDIKFHKGSKDKKVKVTLDVTGELKDGTKFKGSDTVKIKGKKRGDDDDNDDHGKKKHD